MFPPTTRKLRNNRICFSQNTFPQYWVCAIVCTLHIDNSHLKIFCRTLNDECFDLWYIYCVFPFWSCVSGNYSTVWPLARVSMNALGVWVAHTHSIQRDLSSSTYSEKKEFWCRSSSWCSFYVCPTMFIHSYVTCTRGVVPVLINAWPSRWVCLALQSNPKHIKRGTRLVFNDSLNILVVESTPWLIDGSYTLHNALMSLHNGFA